MIGKIPKIYLEIIILFLFIGMVIVLINRDPDNQAFFWNNYFFYAFAIIRILPAFISLNNAYTNLAFFRSPFEIIYEKLNNINFNDFNKELDNSEIDLDRIKVENLKFTYINSKKLF